MAARKGHRAPIFCSEVPTVRCLDEDYAPLPAQPVCRYHFPARPHLLFHGHCSFPRRHGCSGFAFQIARMCAAVVDAQNVLCLLHGYGCRVVRGILLAIPCIRRSALRQHGAIAVPIEQGNRVMLCPQHGTGMKHYNLRMCFGNMQCDESCG